METNISLVHFVELLLRASLDNPFVMDSYVTDFGLLQEPTIGMLITTPQDRQRIDQFMCIGESTNRRIRL